MKGKSFKICKIFGIDINIDPSWFLIFILFTFVIATSYLPYKVPDQPVGLYWLFGTVIALMLFVSVLIHELSHSVVARWFGIPVKEITLFLFGGVAQIEEEPTSPRAEFCIAVVGPISSFVLAGIFWVLAHYLNIGIQLVAISLSYLALINFVLACFNILPGYPMDGGRILKTLLWVILKNELKAAKIVSTIGQGFAFLLIFFGILSVLRGNFTGLWLILIGWFLFGLAVRAYQGLVSKRLAGRAKANKIAKTLQFEDIKPEERCDSDDGLEVILRKMQKRDYLYVVKDNKVTGIITRADIAEYLKHLESEEKKQKK